MMARLRFAARDPGGANVLAALIADWRPAGEPFPIDAWTLPRASRLRAAVPAGREFEDPPMPAALEEAWAEQPADVLVTGTSHYAAFEQTLWRLAAARDVPSLAVLDQWMNLAPRFTDARPAFVGVLDGSQRDELLAIGFSDTSIVHLGHPWLAHLARTAPTPPSPARDRVDVLFVSEPIRSDVEKGANRPFGFDERDVFAIVYAAAIEAARKGVSTRVSVKCHPYEDATAFAGDVARLERVPGVDLEVLGSAVTGLEALQRADVAAGISSMLLMEAMVLGRAVLSIQPGLIREETFVPSSWMRARERQSGDVMRPSFARWRATRRHALARGSRASAKGGCVSEPVILETPRLRLTPFADRHLTDRYVSWLNDSEVVRFSEQRHSRHSLESCRAYVESFRGSASQLWAIELRARADLHVGNIAAYVDAPNKLADVTILIGDREVWGGGIGLEAWTAVCDFLIDRAGIRKVTAGTLATNAGMLSIMRRSGMVDDGRRLNHYLVDGQPVDLVYAARFARA
jgi:RimJ/RimL family protein N-acetyltransferase